MKKLTATLILLAMATAANAQRQDFFLPAYFNTNVFLADNTNTPLHERIAAAEATNASGWSSFPATTNVDMGNNDLGGVSHLNLEANGSIRWGTGAAAARPQIADGGGHLVFLATNKIIFSNDVIHAGSIDMDENSITNIDKLVGFGKTIDFDAGTLDGFALDAGVTNIGFGLTGDGQSVALAVDTNSVVTTGVLADAVGAIETSISGYLPLSGGTLTGNLSLGTYDLEWASPTKIDFNAGSLVVFASSFRVNSSFYASAENLTNFPASILTVSAGNTNYWRITTAPASNSAFGSRGQIAVSSSNVFIYSENALGTGTGRWIRIPGDIAW